jgi:hypothetical protein
MVLPVEDVRAFAKGSGMTFSKPSLLVTSLRKVSGWWEESFCDTYS